MNEKRRKKENKCFKERKKTLKKTFLKKEKKEKNMLKE